MLTIGREMIDDYVKLDFFISLFNNLTRTPRITVEPVLIAIRNLFTLDLNSIAASVAPGGVMELLQLFNKKLYDPVSIIFDFIVPGTGSDSWARPNVFPDECNFITFPDELRDGAIDMITHKYASFNAQQCILVLVALFELCSIIGALCRTFEPSEQYRNPVLNSIEAKIRFFY
jgi:hypothetical protein